MQKGKFEEIKLPKTDCILTTFAQPFCSPSKFNDLWNTIYEVLPSGGIFAANLFGDRCFHKENKEVSTFTKEEVLELLKDYEIIKWKEQEYIKDLENKKWHYFDFVAKKK